MNIFDSKQKESEAFSFDHVFADEKLLLSKRQSETKRDSEALVGLAFSGGGIRSATINLGILQALAKHGLIQSFDYLSTVSGGGYIGAYISSMIKRNGTESIQEALKLSLTTSEDNTNIDKRTKAFNSLQNIQKDIHWLRSYSNYLTPKTGLLTGDTLASFAQWLCNSLVNQLLFASGLLLAFIFINFLSYYPVDYLPADFLSKPLKNYIIGLGFPVVSMLILLLITIIMGVGGRSITSANREVLHRTLGIGGAISLGWLVAFICAVYLPYWLSNYTKGEGGFRVELLSFASYLFSLATAKLGQSKISTATDPSNLINKVSNLLPYIVMSLIFIGAGYASHHIYLSDYTFIWFLGLFIVVMVGNFRFDINIFSLHNFYRNRLTRCYLGASNPARKPNLFTGFDKNDDIKFSELKEQTPIHIINTALNISDGSELAWQQRKAASFCFTPLYSGFELPGKEKGLRGGFRSTSEYTDKEGPKLGSLMAVSGAAASPNCGYHTNPVMGFIMTLFNARLGRWFGNPVKNSSVWKSNSPRHSFLYLAKELFTKSDAKSDFLYLSDGGHFENLGVYELIRRQCKLIIAIDASEDSLYQFEDLGNAIRKCRTDFNVAININIDDLHPNIQSKCGNYKCSSKHYAIGDIIYDQSDESKNGYLLYIKSSLVTELPSDLINYKLIERQFPHHSTVDQFFDESQFESYRCLGEHIADTVMTEIYKSKSPIEKNIVKLTIV